MRRPPEGFELYVEKGFIFMLVLIMLVVFYFLLFKFTKITLIATGVLLLIPISGYFIVKLEKKTGKTIL
jgi:hypothetical protein